MSKSTVRVSVSREDVERLYWRMTGWKAPQRDLDRFLDAVLSHAGSAAPLAGGEPAPGQDAQQSPAEPPGALQPPVSAVPAPEPVETPAGAQSAVQDVDGGQVPHLHITAEITLVLAGPSPQDTPTPPARTRPAGPPRQCSRCKEHKPPSAFCKDSSNKKDGLRRICQDCDNRRKREARRNGARY